MRILCSLLALAHAEITVVPKEKKLIRSNGRSLILTCQGAKNLEWIGPDGRLIDNADRTISPYVQRTSRSLKLRISQLSQSDVGDYTCRSADTVQSSDFEIRSIQIRHEVEFVGMDDVQQFLLGTKADINCNVAETGMNVTSEWFLPGGNVTDPVVGANAANYLIKSISDEDAGFYTCVVSTKTGDVFEREIEVEVEYRPEIVPFAVDDYIKTVGESLSVLCEASGNPLPKTTWQRVNSDGSVVDFREGPKLMFNAIHVENSGVYRCQAENRHGKDTQQIEITIVPPPTIMFDDTTELETDHPFEVILGQPIKLDCNNEIVPFANFVWQLPDGSQLANSQLTIESSRSRDSGEYTCTATINKDMEIIETSKTVNLQVQFAPKPLSTDRVIYSYPKLHTEIRCAFDANPMGNTTLVGAEETTVRGNSISRKFIPQEKDFPSNYSCLSENSIGSDSYQLELKKADSPKLVRLLEFESIGVTGAELNFERDYSEGQIEIESVIVKLEAINRPLKVLRINVNGRSSFSLNELEPETEYTIVVQLKNIVGTSPESQPLSFKTRSIDKLAPTIKINEITARNGEYYVVWDLVKNGGGKLKKISLEYGQYENGSDNKRVMRRTQQETHLPSGSKGELKLSNLEVNKQYWVLLTAHNEKFSSRTAKVDFEPLNASENRLVILLVCIILALVLIIATIDTGCYFTRRRGALNAIINSRVNGAKGAQTLNSEHSSSEDDETQRELSPLNEKLPIDETDGGLVNVAEADNELNQP